MKATEAKLLAFLKKSPQFVIPIYQRSYNWTERECRQLWEDVVRTGQQKDVSAHFVGSIVYVEKGLYSVSSQSPLLVIDGQQRLTTMTLLIEALARTIGDAEPVDGFSAKKLRNYYLLNPEESGERHYKLVLSQTDRESLIAILNGQPQPKEVSIRVQANFELFEQWIAQEKNNLETVCEGIAKLVIVDISLDRDQDNPQLIFESLNSTGRELSQADLIRNFVLMGLDPELQTKLYERYWRPMELDFGQEAYATQFDAFMRHYLTVKTGDIPNVREVYEAFKSFARSERFTTTEALVADIREYSRYYCAFALGAETDPELKPAFEDIRGLKVDVSYPFLLELYRDYESGVLSKENFAEIARLIESYVFRRSICAIPTNSHNKTFATVAKSIQKDRYLESVQAHFLALPSYRRLPRDEEFVRELQMRDLYNFPRRMYFLRRLENEGRKEPVQVEEFTIEHILPQNENLSAQWRTDLGPEWSRIQQTYLHTLGNLTLTGYNSEYSDRSFAEKRDMAGGFAKSPLHLNDMLRDCPAWTETAITERAGLLAARAVNVWTAPLLDPTTLAAYQPKQVAASRYGIEDHAQLRGGPIRAIFDALRREVLAIDPAVTEEFKKYYVAYKAETNFVDVVPQMKRLVLSLNIDFHALDDPRRIARDVTGLGKWGNGDVNIPLASVDDLPYVMGLVRQAFDQQMANGDA
jgi:uncharacterized protein with ParB-like and HNH nuclease domain/predicted transport protein